MTQDFLDGANDLREQFTDAPEPTPTPEPTPQPPEPTPQPPEPTPQPPELTPQPPEPTTPDEPLLIAIDGEREYWLNPDGSVTEVDNRYGDGDPVVSDTGLTGEIMPDGTIVNFFWGGKLRGKCCL